MEFIAPSKSYFAAANGFSGFRSYFNSVFSPKKFTRLYILKGGAGTGKSSLMKKIGSHFIDKEIHTEAIFCSSDTASLDGIIIEKKPFRFAILDGTAPHETDARFPGAVDEIINLGEFWNKEELIQQRKEIVSHAEHKAAHYKKAYEFLYLAGEVKKKIDSIITNAFLGTTDKVINDILSNLTCLNCGRNEGAILLSAFGKDGYTSNFSEKIPFSSGISVSGIWGSEHLFLNLLKKECDSKSASYIYIPTPFSDDLAEGIWFPIYEKLIFANATFKTKIDTSELLDKTKISEQKDTLYTLEQAKCRFLSSAQDEFTLASAEHFSLEKIYTPTMNFDKLNSLADKIITEIEHFI